MNALGIVLLAFAGLGLVFAVACAVVRCPACRRAHDSQEAEDACVRRHLDLTEHLRTYERAGHEHGAGCGCIGKDKP